ncbi:DUF3783 domain-containing protein [Clostridium boliviensis]|uniref:DUF3783 domain-containing protein n=1 Tax=Clostridium boliviensis TaxID=318465 RepID=A0ABU4GHB9_9CLOT|nr:DUF3783 domain-containing protein [Clostridium boliviensis]MDW2797021.1 DUF3783 domain-containing protein [Clostridium boliviensis]
MQVKKEMVLYYCPEKESQKGNNTRVARLKAVLIQMGIRIKNISPDQTSQTIGYLAGSEGFEEQPAGECPVVEEEILVMKNFSSKRIDELLMNLKRSGVSKIALKAVITDTNSKWSFYDLYQELKKEHETMTGKEES